MHRLTVKSVAVQSERQAARDGIPTVKARVIRVYRARTSVMKMPNNINLYKIMHSRM